LLLQAEVWLSCEYEDCFMFQGTRNGFSCDGESYGAKEDARLLHVSGGLKMACGRNFGMLQVCFFKFQKHKLYETLRSGQYLTSLYAWISHCGMHFALSAHRCGKHGVSVAFRFVNISSTSELSGLSAAAMLPQRLLLCCGCSAKGVKR
jgi:hypothetical protein